MEMPFGVLVNGFEFSISNIYESKQYLVPRLLTKLSVVQVIFL